MRKMVDPMEVAPSKFNPRFGRTFEIESLAQDIAKRGLIYPPKVRVLKEKTKEGEIYEVIDGDRRVSACRVLKEQDKLEKIPVDILEDIDNGEVIDLRFLSNLLSKTMYDYEYGGLLTHKGIYLMKQDGLTVDDWYKGGKTRAPYIAKLADLYPFSAQRVRTCLSLWNRLPSKYKEALFELRDTLDKLGLTKTEVRTIFSSMKDPSLAPSMMRAQSKVKAPMQVLRTVARKYNDNPLLNVEQELIQQKERFEKPWNVKLPSTFRKRAKKVQTALRRKGERKDLNHILKEGADRGLEMEEEKLGLKPTPSE